MKFIRLTTEDPNCIFDNQFNEDIVIEPHSKIALQNFTSQIDIEQIVINAQNDKIDFTMNGDTSIKSLHLLNGTFQSSNINDLFTDATQKMNSLSDYTQAQLGKQWLVNLSNSKVKFSCNRGSYIDPSDNSFNSLVGLYQCAKVSPSSIIFQRNGGTVGNLDSFMYFKSPQCKGSASFRAKISAVPENINLNGCILAYMSEPPNSTTTLIDILQIKYGIIFYNETEDYKIIMNGVITEANQNINPNVNDYITIDTSNNFITGNVWNGNVMTTLFVDQYDHQTNYYPVLIFVGGSGDYAMTTIRFTSDPFYNLNNPSGTNGEDTGFGAIPTGSNILKTNHMINFIDNDLALFLGFRYGRYPQEGYIKNKDVSFVADKQFLLVNYSESYVVELQNLNIDSYDALTKKRRNMLHVIPKYDVIADKIIYSSNYPLFLNLNNANKISLRNIKAIVLKEDLSAITSIGLSQLCILIDN